MLPGSAPRQSERTQHRTCAMPQGIAKSLCFAGHEAVTEPASGGEATFENCRSTFIKDGHPDHALARSGPRPGPVRATPPTPVSRAALRRATLRRASSPRRITIRRAPSIPTALEWQERITGASATASAAPASSTRRRRRSTPRTWHERPWVRVRWRPGFAAVGRRLRPAACRGGAP
jgi:hypothetical protein